MNLYTEAKRALAEVLEEGGSIEDAARRLLCDADVRHILHEPYIKGANPMVVNVIDRARHPVMVV